MVTAWKGNGVVCVCVCVVVVVVVVMVGAATRRVSSSSSSRRRSMEITYRSQVKAGVTTLEIIKNIFRTQTARLHHDVL